MSRSHVGEIPSDRAVQRLAVTHTLNRPSRRVLHLVHWMNPGGVENWLLSLLRQVDRNRWEMDLCCKGPAVGSLAGTAVSLGARVHHCPWGLTGWNFAGCLERLLRKGRYDILHIHTDVFSGVPVRVARKCGVHSVLTFHSTSFQSSLRGIATLVRPVRALYARWSIRTACRRADLVLGCSHAVLDRVRKKYGIPESANQDVWYSGVVPFGPLSSQRRLDFRKRLGIGETDIVVVHVGSFRRAKNHLGLLRVAAKVGEINPRVRFLLAGDGPLRPAAEAIVLRNRLRATVRILGECRNVEELLGASDLFFFPSRWEGLPVSVLEAQMAGLPVVASDIPSIREAVSPGQTALLFDRKDETGMAEAILGLSEDSGRRKTLGENSRAWVLSRFTAELSAQRITEAYDHLCSTNSVT